MSLRADDKNSAGFPLFSTLESQGSTVEQDTATHFSNLPMSLGHPLIEADFNTLRTGDADLRFYVTTMQDGGRRFPFLTR